MKKLRFIDLFCGIGGFRVAFEQACKESGVKSKCVFSSDIDKFAQDSYEANFGDRPAGDITKVDEQSIPDHDVLFAGFPCQAFSIIGLRGGFDDTRGTLFFDVARILKEKKPKAFILENVKQLAGHDKGRTLQTILATLKELKYDVHFKVLNALDYGLPQKRERVVIVGHREPIMFSFPEKVENFIPLSKILEPDDAVDPKFIASDYIQNKRAEAHISKWSPGIWHENKSGNVTSYPYSCALRAGASYSYLLVDGKRRLTPREMLRLQGFPDSYKVTVSDGQIRKQAGNSVPVNMIKAVCLKLLPFIAESISSTMVLREPEPEYN
jgi:DNA (cytosine-5)-methyltransferase 1